MSKVSDILEVVRGSSIMGDSLAEYHVARLIRDAGRRVSSIARFQTVREAAKRTRLVISLDSATEIVRIRNNVSGLEYSMEPRL